MLNLSVVIVLHFIHNYIQNCILVHRKKEEFYNIRRIHLIISTLNVKFCGDKLYVKWRVVIMEVLKVSAKSSPNSVAGALAGVLREKGEAEIQAIGAGAINQAVKAVAIARGFVAPSGIDLVCIPAFTDIQIDGEERTAIKLIVQPR